MKDKALKKLRKLTGGEYKTGDIPLGAIVRDTITGFEGKVTSITLWLNGCDRIGVQPVDLDKDGKVKEAMVIDALQLDLVEDTGHVRNASTGGPQDDAAALGRACL